MSDPTNEEIAILMEEITEDNRFSLSLDELIIDISNTLENITVFQATKAHAELQNAKIYLSMARSELNKVKQNLDF